MCSLCLSHVLGQANYYNVSTIIIYISLSYPSTRYINIILISFSFMLILASIAIVSMEMLAFRVKQPGVNTPSQSSYYFMMNLKNPHFLVSYDIKGDIYTL